MLNFFQGDSYGNLTGDNNVVRRIINKDDLDLDKVTIIDLSSCELITDEALKIITQKCSRLKQLIVPACYNVTDEGIRAVLQSNPNINRLIFSSCRKVTVDIIDAIIAHTPNIKIINADGVGWSVIPDDIDFGTLHKLEWFGLGYNKIKKLPQSMVNLPHNCSIRIDGNPLQSPPMEMANNGIMTPTTFAEETAKSNKTAQNDNEVVAPEECQIMISFNDRSAGENAEALARFLTNKNFPTFCTRIFCPANVGDWRDATEKGVKTCKIYIPLLTKGWQKSDECQYETRLIRNRFAARAVTIMPVYYEDFDEAYDDTTDGHGYKFKWNDLQSVFREKGDEDKWMNTIISLLPKEGSLDSATSLQNETAEKKTKETTDYTGESRKGQRKISKTSMYTFDDLLKNADCIPRSYEVNIGNGMTKVVVSTDMIKNKRTSTKVDEYIHGRREGKFHIFPEDMDPVEISSLGVEDCRKIDPLQFMAMTEAQVRAFTSEQASYFSQFESREISFILEYWRDMWGRTHSFGSCSGKSPGHLNGDRPPNIGEKYDKTTCNEYYQIISNKGIFHFKNGEYAWIRRTDGSLTYGQVMYERNAHGKFETWTSTQLDEWVSNLSNEYSHRIGNMVIPESIDGAILLRESVEGLVNAGIPQVKAESLHRTVRQIVFLGIYPEVSAQNETAKKMTDASLCQKMTMMICRCIRIR